MAEDSKREVAVDALPQCNLCTEPAHYDAKTKAGPWAYLCEAHYAEYGVGLGSGKGQRLVVREPSDHATNPEWQSCQRVLAGAKDEVEKLQELIESGDNDTAFSYYERMLEQLYAYADTMARIEGHRDGQLVLERELDL